MKKFLCNFIFLCFILLLVSSIIEIALLYKTNTYSYKHQYVESHLDEIKVLIMGNSHTLYALIPDSMTKKAFNTAISGRNIFYDVELVKKYLPRMNHLETVVVPLDYFNFYLGREIQNPKYFRFEKDMNSTQKCMYYKYMGIPAESVWFWSELLNSKLKFMSRFWESAAAARECDSLGSQRLRLSGRKAGWELVKLPKLIDKSINPNQEKLKQLNDLYNELCSVSNQKDVRLLLVSTPMYKTYQKDMDSCVVNEMHEFAYSLCQKYPNTEYYDFSYDDHFVKDDFNDASHLLESGAIKFTHIINDIIQDKYGCNIDNTNDII